ncbi:uncharacterized protein L969DRAFT_91794 [Mixia osmundae IAM 14324]|uniref:SMP-LTD domain-containing protein n=1 Tax=Mixia osmundae (strain CBS 9802 / IAM 14324 / JCM 22182 / KY 12970) TaxID=764103 RepID=G7EAJ3_MIXOS|nr:uncharacterized protein L969DRAFT_91794 [Mixia osmundae IAM 14324]KEI42343.1 hypothetical protein L969DRAFT_91794 [Mixia osmundae IAM 14324]GAA99853.1 hypothetical protein E5Q_06556 [Mixia osmundae IAM 14324]
MTGFKALLIVYVVGGLTFVPLLVISLVALILYTSPVVAPDDDPELRKVPADEAVKTANKIKTDATAARKKDASTSAVASSSEDEDEPGLPTPPTLYKAGWLTVRRTFEPTVVTDGTYMGMMGSAYRSFMDNRSKDPRRNKPKDRFYAALKQNVLFLYDTEQQVDVWAAIEVTLHTVSIYPEVVLDGELFMKRNAVCLRPKSSQALAEHVTDSNTSESQSASPGKPMPWFLFPSSNIDKEDWYHALVQATKLSDDEPDTTFIRDRSLFDPHDMSRLIEGIDDQPDPIPMRWLNAMLGRIFFSVYRTASLENYIINRIIRKLNRVNKPSFLSDIVVREVNVGSSVPYFSKPMLKDLTVDGDASMDVHVSYKGNFRVTISTVATINLGQRFKPYTVRLVLAVVLKELEGNLLVRVKKPPSNRLWFGFSTSPTLVLSVEPVVSTRQIKWSMILKPIESRLREIVLESVVLPHMDDISFFDTRSYTHRGGIWGDAARKADDPLSPGLDAHPVGEEGDHDVPEAELDTASEPRQDTLTADSTRQRKGKRNAETSPDGRPASVASAPPMTETKSEGIPSSASTLSLPTWAAKTEDKDTSRRKSWFVGSKPTPSSSVPRSRASSVSDGPEKPTVIADEGADAAAKLREALSASRGRSVEPTATVNSDTKAEPARSDSPGSTKRDKAYEQLLDAAVRSDSPETASQVDPAETKLDEAPAYPPATSVAAPGPTHKMSDVVVEAAAKKEGFLPPPRRSAAADASLQKPTSSLLSSWRAKASDKEALATSVNQARDAAKKWAANWRKPVVQEPGEAASPNGTIEGASDVPGLELSKPSPGKPKARPVSRKSSPDRAMTYKDYLAAKNRDSAESDAAADAAVMSSSPEKHERAHRPSISSSPSGHFRPAASKPTTSVTSSPQTGPRKVPPGPAENTLSTSPSQHARRTSNTNLGYRPTAKMTVPGMAPGRQFGIGSTNAPTSVSPSLSPLTAAAVAKPELSTEPFEPLALPTSASQASSALAVATSSAPVHTPTPLSELSQPAVEIPAEAAGRTAVDLPPTTSTATQDVGAAKEIDERPEDEELAWGLDEINDDAAVTT